MISLFSPVLPQRAEEKRGRGAEESKWMANSKFEIRNSKSG
jgi:hypothetical protein